MQPTPIQTSIAAKRPRGASGSSGRNRPGSRARLATRLRIEETPTGPARQHIPSSADFPPLSFGLQDGYVFDSRPRATSVVGGMSVTGVLARPTGVDIDTSTAAKREGINMGTNVAMSVNFFPQPMMSTRSTSAGVASSINDFMGGRRGEMSPDDPQNSSYLGEPQFSRRGNLLPARSSTGGTSTRTSNASAPLNTNSTPNPFAMTAAAGTSLTHRSAEYEVGKNFDRLRVQGQHLGLTTSPYFPKCKEDLIKHREERKNDARDAMNKRIREKEELMHLKSMDGCEGALVKIKPAFGGKVFTDGLSSMLAKKTSWRHPSLDAKLPELVDWPTLTEVKQAGSKRTGLPVPKLKAEEGMLAEDFEYFAGDRFGFARRAHEKVALNENTIKSLGDMKSLFKEIDG